MIPSLNSIYIILWISELIQSYPKINRSRMIKDKNLFNSNPFNIPKTEAIRNMSYLLKSIHQKEPSLLVNLYSQEFKDELVSLNIINNKDINENYCAEYIQDLISESFHGLKYPDRSTRVSEMLDDLLPSLPYWIRDQETVYILPQDIESINDIASTNHLSKILMLLR